MIIVWVLFDFNDFLVLDILPLETIILTYLVFLTFSHVSYFSVSNLSALEKDSTHSKEVFSDL